MPKYNSMETAPKDGTNILVWNVGLWQRWNEEGNEIEPEKRGEWMSVAWLDNKWIVPDSWDNYDEDYVVAGNPTCWTPLPEPPDEYR